MWSPFDRQGEVLPLHVVLIVLYPAFGVVLSGTEAWLITCMYFALADWFHVSIQRSHLGSPFLIHLVYRH